MGSSGPNVKALQLQLNYATGTHLVVDGMFGAATNQAVVNLQKFFHLPIDGVVGPKTWFTLEACVVNKQKREGRA
jgi:peptidoglycan hydrolase-like protein with peptidoglycan-binding domain